MSRAEPLRRLAFGSCRKQTYNQSIFSSIVAERPEVWLWTGDAIYPTAPSDAEEIREAYALAGKDKDEKALLSAVHTVEGVYDDHDFGENDGGRNNPNRDLARRLFLDEVLHEPLDSARRSQPGGLYAARTFGSPPHQVKLLMLDLRYARDDHAVPSLGASRWLPKPGYCAALLRLLSSGAPAKTRTRTVCFHPRLEPQTAVCGGVVLSARCGEAARRRDDGAGAVVVARGGADQLGCRGAPDRVVGASADEQPTGRVVGPLPPRARSPPPSPRAHAPGLRVAALR